MFGPRMRDMQEATAGVIKLSVDSVQAFDRIYEFMMGAPVSAKSTQDWIDVVRLADEYLMTSLVAHCDRHFCRMLSIDNAVELLLSTASVRLPQLQASARRLIAGTVAVLFLPSHARVSAHPPPSSCAFSIAILDSEDGCSDGFWL
eukprot:TRINITY_DN8077_c0_g1_i1.p1 TRINITY_DN8077_c0_g1~~TRINITY_DN8077_c0_g1_i1.p1  ORF type:complete len:146 (+),score=21.00 TRINITY_DN8077_c0_g1_i1:152-589(+)